MRVNPLIVALDQGDRSFVEALVVQLSAFVGAFKVGFYPFLLFGWELIEFIYGRGSRVFLDLKFYDIPATVANAVEVAARKGVFMLTLHTMGGSEMMAEASQRARVTSPRPFLLGVTLLTSVDEGGMSEVGLAGSLIDRVLALASLAKDAGLDGVVVSPLEVSMIKSALGRDFLVITPGVRPLGVHHQDQRRVATPREALEAGADYLVVGRPICEASDPLAVVRSILKEVEA